jgi:hypothetical protein
MRPRLVGCGETTKGMLLEALAYKLAGGSVPSRHAVPGRYRELGGDDRVGAGD